MINDDNFLLHAMRGYENISCRTIEQFSEDVKKFSILRRLTGKDVCPIKTHIILNMIIHLMNMFEFKCCVRLMFFKCEKKYHYKLKTILTYLDRNVNTEITDYEEIEICPKMMKTLKKI